MISRSEPVWFRIWYAYLIRLDRPLGGQKHKARFYLGIAVNWRDRFIQHCRKQGAKMLKAAVEKGIPFRLVRVWQFDSARRASSFETWGKHSVKNHRKLLRLPIPDWIGGWLMPAKEYRQWRSNQLPQLLAA